jgi:glutaminyl-peptide cyclotransferase
MRKILSLLAICSFVLLLPACESSQKKSVAEVEAPGAAVKVPAFNASNAYTYIEQQVAFGPRIPNTEPHQLTKTYLMEELEKAGAKVVTQEFTANTYDNEQWELTNIIGSILPEKKKRILLAAHWDSRKVADKDSERQNEPIDGANDGASGVGVIIEILNAISTSSLKPDVGVDVIFFDGEDNGEPNGQASVPTATTDGSWWCLGSQYWSKNKHEVNYSAYYGILFDMVGAANATFYMEGFSSQYAPSIVSKVWNTSEEIGFGNYFVSEEVPPITDDHYYVNKYAKIPMIDIIAYDPLSGQFFPDYHHTHNDHMDIISQETLKAVGQTVLRVIYKEKP